MHHRPHRSLGVATPASGFTTPAASSDQHGELPLRLPPSLIALPATTEPAPSPATVISNDTDAVEIDRIVPASGNMFAAGRQVWLGTSLAGQEVTLRLDHATLPVFHHGQLIKTHSITWPGCEPLAAGPPGPHPRPPTPGPSSRRSPAAAQAATPPMGSKLSSASDDRTGA